MEDKSKTKTKRVRFTTKNNERREISLSCRYSDSLFLEFKRLVKLLSDVERFGTRLSNRDASQVELLPLELRKKLIDNKLLHAKLDEKIPTLGQLCDLVRKAKSRLDAKSVLAYKRIFDYLIGYHGADKRIDLITSTDADLHITWLMTERKPPLSGGTISRSIRSFRTVFKYAIKAKWLTLNPYSEVQGGCVRDEDKVEFVEESTVQKVIAACPNDELRLILALSRYAGLRPHEMQKLKFEHFRIDEPIPYFEIPAKTKTGFRQVPYFPVLIPYFEAVRSVVPPDQEFIFEYYRHHTNWGTAIAKVAKKAGVRMWKKPFNNPRSSRTTELDAQGTPQSTMDAVFGNTEKVRKTHYLQFREKEAFTKLLGMTKTNLKNVESFQQIPPEIAPFFSAFSEIFGDDLSFSRIQKVLCSDVESRRKLMDLYRSHPDLSGCYTDLSALFEEVNGLKLWELPNNVQIERANNFVQSAAQHFEEYVKSFDNSLDRVGLEPTT